MSTLSNVISLPASCSPSSSTRSVSPFITRYCLPPVTRTAYMIAFPDFVDLLVVLLWLPAIEGEQKRNCRGFRGLGSTTPCRRAPLGSDFSCESGLRLLPCKARAGRGAPRLQSISVPRIAASARRWVSLRSTHPPSLRGSWAPDHRDTIRASG